MYLCDTAGMESLHKRNLTRSYYLECQVALLVYSADDMDSVDDLKDYVDDVVSHSPGAKKFLVRNKIDLEDQSVIEKDVDEKFKKYGYHFAPEWQFKTSASKGDGIKNLLEEIGKVLLKQGKSFKTDEKNSFQVYRQKQKPSKSRSSSCCN
jgi:GTPase SAR1 family protein